MGLHFNYPVPRRVSDTINNMSTGQMADLICELQIPDLDMPDSDLYDWLRKRIFDWLYDPDWTEPTDRDAEEVALAAARSRVADTAREAERASHKLAQLEGNIRDTYAKEICRRHELPFVGRVDLSVLDPTPLPCRTCPFIGGCTVVDGRRACPASE